MIASYALFDDCVFAQRPRRRCRGRRRLTGRVAVAHHSSPQAPAFALTRCCSLEVVPSEPSLQSKFWA